jgi:hypothetical protein
LDGDFSCGWIDGVPLQIAKPYGDVGFFRSAKVALRLLHRAGIMRVGSSISLFEQCSRGA